MAASTVGVTGSGPLSVTDTTGRQLFVPLSAFELTIGSAVTLKSDWKSALTTADALTVRLLERLANDRLDAGALAAVPVSP